MNKVNIDESRADSVHSTELVAFRLNIVFVLRIHHKQIILDTYVKNH